MRSIRRSLIGYFLVLTLVALSAMGVLIDQYTRYEFERGRSNEIELAKKHYEDQRKGEIDKLDQALFDRANAVGLSTRFIPFIATRQYSQGQVNLTPAAVSFGLVGPFQAATISAVVEPSRRLRNRIQEQVWQDYIHSPPVGQAFMKNIDDDDHFSDLYQIHPSQSHQPWRSQSLGDVTLPLHKTDFPNPYFGWKPYNFTLPNGTPIRAVVLAFSAFGPGSGPSPGSGRGGGGRGGPVRPAPVGPTLPPPTTGPAPTDGYPRLYVHAARPLDTLDSRFAEFEHERTAQIDRINDDADRTVLLLRVSVIGIISAAVIALLVGSLVLTRRGLKPLDRLSAAVSRVSERDFLLPVKAEELSTELAPVHARLTDTLDALKRAFEREKQSVADISHELRTPIAAMGVTFDVALKKARSPEQYQQTLAECRDINKQLGKLVERIMTLATLDAGTAGTASDTVDAADLAAGCATIIKPLAEANGVTLSTALARPLPVTTDPDKLREVLMNLLHNAVEYNRPGGVIELTATGGNGHGVTFDVRDSGIGMTPDVRAKIFERFYRADPSRTATGVHAGLGLAIVKEYVARLGGSIAVDSTPNVGSTFRVTIPSGSNGAA